MTITKFQDNLKFYKLSEVALKNGKDSSEVWIVYKDSVYDVTNYLNSHPGGSELVMEFAGKDCTKDFKDAGHSDDAMKNLKNLKVGELVEEDRKVNRGKSINNFDSNILNESKKKKKRLGGFMFC